MRGYSTRGIILSILGAILLCFAVIWTPIWVQIVLFVLGVWLLPVWIVLYIPAALSDTLYAPSSQFSPFIFKTIIFVVLLHIVQWIIITKTRAPFLYAMEK